MKSRLVVLVVLASLFALTPRHQLSPTEAATAPKVTKVLVFVEENHSLSQMRTGMPYAFSLAKRYGYATHYRAITHPSLPNYIAIASGSTYGITDSHPPAYHHLRGRTVLGAAIAAGVKAKTYNEGMTSNCLRYDTGRYSVRHNPWAYFTDPTERYNCLKHDVPFGTFAGDVAAGTLPTIGIITPNMCHDGHDCSLATADAWFKARMATIFAGPGWRTGRLAIVLTADEDNYGGNNTVLTAVIHPSQHNNVVTTALNHYSLTRLLGAVSHTRPLRNAATAPSMSAAFGFSIG
jgi:hypothetical protein